MNKFETAYNRIQEAIGGSYTNNPQKTETDLDTLANTLAKEQNPAVIKKALGTLVNPIPGADAAKQQNQPSISMTGTSGPTTSTTNQAGQRTQAPATNTGNSAPTPPQTNTQAAKQQIKDEEIDKILNDIGVDRIYNRLQKAK